MRGRHRNGQTDCEDAIAGRQCLINFHEKKFMLEVPPKKKVLAKIFFQEVNGQSERSILIQNRNVTTKE